MNFGNNYQKNGLDSPTTNITDDKSATYDIVQDNKILIKFSDVNDPLFFDFGNFEKQKGLIMPV